MPGHRIFTTSFASIYPHYVTKAERKDRSKEEVDEVIAWLTGYDEAGLDRAIETGVDMETFFAEAPRVQPERRPHHGGDLRCTGWRRSGPPHAEDPVPGQARRRAGRGKRMTTILRDGGRGA